MNLPKFKYHPNAYQLEIFKKSDRACQCCQQARGLIYDKTPYAIETLVAICPWCIADGSAAQKFDAEFIQDIEPPDGDFQKPHTLNQSIVDELSYRTPGYVSWQGEYWLTHCDDGCEFHGDVQQNELLSLPEASLRLLRQEHPYLFGANETIADVNKDYFPAGDMALYKFVCRHCGFIRLHCDMS
jgi:uncharacterized protein